MTHNSNIIQGTRMDVKHHIKLSIFLTFASILAIFIPDTTAMAQDITLAQPTVLPRNDSGMGFSDGVWLILLALGGFLYLVNNRSV